MYKVLLVFALGAMYIEGYTQVYVAKKVPFFGADTIILHEDMSFTYLQSFKKPFTPYGWPSSKGYWDQIDRTSLVLNTCDTPRIDQVVNIEQDLLPLLGDTIRVRLLDANGNNLPSRLVDAFSTKLGLITTNGDTLFNSNIKFDDPVVRFEYFVCKNPKALIVVTSMGTMFVRRGKIVEKEGSLEVFSIELGDKNDITLYISPNNYTKVLMDEEVWVRKFRYIYSKERPDLRFYRIWRKSVRVYLKQYENGREAWQQIHAYFQFYNHRRPHSKLGGKVPAEVFCKEVS